MEDDITNLKKYGHWFKYLGRKAIDKAKPNLTDIEATYQHNQFFSREDYYKMHPSRRNRV